MEAEKKPGFIAGAASISVIWILIGYVLCSDFDFYLTGECEIEENNVITNKINNIDIVVYSKSCGATTGATSNIAFRGQAKKTYDNILTIDESSDIEIEWVSAFKLNINARTSRIYYMVSQMGNIMITYNISEK